MVSFLVAKIWVVDVDFMFFLRPEANNLKVPFPLVLSRRDCTHFQVREFDG